VSERPLSEKKKINTKIAIGEKHYFPGMPANTHAQASWSLHEEAGDHGRHDRPFCNLALTRQKQGDQNNQVVPLFHGPLQKQTGQFLGPPPLEGHGRIARDPADSKHDGRL
jgi:hypothetical protein